MVKQLSSLISDKFEFSLDETSVFSFDVNSYDSSSN